MLKPRRSGAETSTRVAQLIATTRRSGPARGGRSLSFAADDRRALAGFVVLAILVPLFCGALIAYNPVYGVALLAVIGAVWLAVKSLVYPLALGGVPSLLIGLYGTNPPPPKGVFLLLTIWLFLGLGLALLAGRGRRRRRSGGSSRRPSS